MLHIFVRMDYKLHISIFHMITDGYVQIPLIILLLAVRTTSSYCGRWFVACQMNPMTSMHFLVCVCIYQSKIVSRERIS